MADQQPGAAGEEFVDRGQQPLFGGQIQGRGGLVQDQHQRVLQQRPGDGDALALAAGQGGAASTDVTGIALRQSGREFVDLGPGGSRAQFGCAGLGADVADVVLQAAGEQGRVRTHHGHPSAQFGRVEATQVDPVEPDAALLGIVVAQDQVDQGALADPGDADQAGAAAGRQDQVDPAQQGLALRAVAEADVLEAQFAAGRGRQGQRRGGRAHGRLGGAQFAHPAEADPGPLPGHVQPLQGLQRTIGPGQVSREGDQCAHCEFALQGQPAAGDEHQGGAERGHEARHRGRGVLGQLQAQGVAPELLVEFMQARRLARFGGRGLDGLDRRQALEEEGVDTTGALAHLPGQALDPGPQPAQEHQVGGQQQQGQQRQPRAEAEHQRQRPGQGQHRVDPGEQGVDREALDLGDVAVEPGQQVTAADPGVVGRRQAQQVGEHRFAQGVQHPGRDIDVVPAVERPDQAGAEADRDHQGAVAQQDVEIAGQQAVVDQELGQVGLGQAQPGAEQRQAEDQAQAAALRTDEAQQPAAGGAVLRLIHAGAGAGRGGASGCAGGRGVRRRAAGSSWGRCSPASAARE